MAYDVRCPKCGTENKNLFLEETDGWMECEGCGTLSRVEISEETLVSTYVPVLPVPS